MNDTIIFLVLAGIALLFKWLSREGSADGAKPKPPSTPNEPPARPAAESEEERVRRFLEALGVPSGSEPPPPVRPRQVTPRRVVTPKHAPARAERDSRRWAQPLPPLTSAPPVEPVVVIESAPPPVEAPPPPASVVPLPPPRPLARPAIVPPLRSALPSLGEMLRTRGSVRQAVILREILGPPRGRQVFDPLGDF